MKVINFLDSFYSKLPNFGSEIKDFIVKVLPFLAILTGIIITFSSVVDILGTPFLNALTRGGGATSFPKTYDCKRNWSTRGIIYDFGIQRS